MVTPALDRMRRAPTRLAVGLLLALLLALLVPASAAAQSGTLYLLTFKRGITDASGTGENLFESLAAAHGPLQGSRSADLTSTELDIYGISGDHAGLAVGVDLQGYEQEWFLADGESIYMRTFGMLFTFKAFARLGSVFPFLGVGMGNYYVNFRQTLAGISFRDSPAGVYTGRVGTRILFGRLGLLLEAGDTRARLPVTTDVGVVDVELGGRYAAAGLSLIF